MKKLIVLLFATLLATAAHGASWKDKSGITETTTPDGTEFTPLQKTVGATTTDHWLSLSTLKTWIFSDINEIPGVTSTQISYLGDTTGPIQAGIDSKQCKATTKIATGDYTIGTTDPCELYNGVIFLTVTGTATAPAVAVNHSYCVVTVGDIAGHFDPNAADRLNLDGTTLADGDKASNTSKSGDTICCQYYSADGLYCWSGTVLGGHWTDGN